MSRSTHVRSLGLIVLAVAAVVACSPADGQSQFNSCKARAIGRIPNADKAKFVDAVVTQARGGTQQVAFFADATDQQGRRVRHYVLCTSRDGGEMVPQVGDTDFLRRSVTQIQNENRDKIFQPK